MRIGDPHDHVSPDDPRYDGHRIERLWAVTGVDPADDQEGVLHVDARAALTFGLDAGVALGTDERRAAHLREFGQWVAEGNPGVEIRIREFELVAEERL